MEGATALSGTPGSPPLVGSRGLPARPHHPASLHPGRPSLAARLDLALGLRSRLAPPLACLRAAEEAAQGQTDR